MKHLFPGLDAHFSLLLVYAEPTEFCVVITAVIVSVIYMFGLVHCIGNDDISGSNRLFWSLLIVVLPVIGTALYWFLGRKNPLPIQFFKEPEID